MRAWAIGMARGGGIGLLFAALLLRLLVPAGYMPVEGRGFAVTLCTGMGRVEAWMDASGHIHKQKPDDAKGEQPCIFAGHAAALDLPPMPAAAEAPMAAAQIMAGLPRWTVAVGQGLAAPPPPATGPPSGI